MVCLSAGLLSQRLPIIGKHLQPFIEHMFLAYDDDDNALECVLTELFDIDELLRSVLWDRYSFDQNHVLRADDV